MDPQKLSQLDPKLREAYQRVMGTVIPDPQSAPAQPQTPPASVPTTDSPVASVSNPIPAPAPTIQEPAVPTQPTQIPTPEPTIPTTPPQTPGDQQRDPFFIPQPESNPQPQTPPTGMPTPEPPASPQQTSSNFVQMNSEVPTAPQTPIQANYSNFATPPAVPQAQTMAVKKKNGMMPVLFGIVGLVFLVIYTLFWTKIFNFKLPFLP